MRCIPGTPKCLPALIKDNSEITIFFVDGDVFLSVFTLLFFPSSHHHQLKLKEKSWKETQKKTSFSNDLQFSFCNLNIYLIPPSLQNHQFAFAHTDLIGHSQRKTWFFSLSLLCFFHLQPPYPKVTVALCWFRHYIMEKTKKNMTTAFQLFPVSISVWYVMMMRSVDNLGSRQYTVSSYHLSLISPVACLLKYLVSQTVLLKISN